MVTNRSIEVGRGRIGYEFQLELGKLIDSIGLRDYQLCDVEDYFHGSTKLGVSDRQRSLLLILNRLQ